MTTAAQIIRELVRDADKELDQAREVFQLAAALIGDGEITISAEDWRRAKNRRTFGIINEPDGGVKVKVER